MAYYTEIQDEGLAVEEDTLDEECPLSDVLEVLLRPARKIRSDREKSFS